MKNSLINREYLRTWHNIPALLITAFVIVKVAESIAASRERKAVKKWYKDLIERGKGN